MTARRKINTKNIIIAGLAIAGLAMIYSVFNPVESAFFPQCIFHKLTGLQCPGCGAQRMLHALLHGDIHSAFRFNAFLLISVPFLLWMIWLEFNRTKHRVLYARFYRMRTIVIIGTLLLAWLIGRNILGI